MTPQEQQMIDGLVDRIRTTQVNDKDTAAEQHLQQGLAGSPDALYILAQTVLVQQYGLQQAQSQLQQAQSQLQQAQSQTKDLQDQIEDLRQRAASAPPPSTGGSFLSHLFGSGSPTPPPPQQAPFQPVNTGYTNAPPPPYPGAAYAQPYGQAYPQPYAQPAAYAPAGGGFLRGALQTAAGVAAGEMAFAGMESLFHGFGGGGYGGGSFGGGSFGGGRPEEIINNNYYGESGDHHEGAHHDLADTSSSHNDGFGNDTSATQFADSQDVNRNAQDPNQTEDFASSTSNDDSAYDTLNDNSGFDSTDNSSFDNADSGDSSNSFDDGGGGFDSSDQS